MNKEQEKIVVRALYSICSALAGKFWANDALSCSLGELACLEEDLLKEEEK